MPRSSMVAPALAAVIALAGCAAGDEGAASPTPSVTATTATESATAADSTASPAPATSDPTASDPAASATSPTPRPTPAASTDAATAITPTGVGPFTTEMTLTEAAAVTGEDYSMDMEAFGGHCAAVILGGDGPWAPIWALAESEGADGPIDTFGYGIAQDEPAAVDARTSEGIGLGSTMAHITAAYGADLETREGFYDVASTDVFVAAGPDGFGYKFVLGADGAVREWGAGRLEQLHYVEGCA
ncbi:hypothetical protein [Demequina pelophila]|uniref:hypothetical protein n=1 Tax=Demequina pelophila TaxID=1638984 RepID=UPI0007811D35|nr:hypothetical protein [Demequina pelophila]